MDVDFSYKKETDAVIGSAFDVWNEIGHGFHEKPYENALAVEFGYRNIPFSQQPRYSINYRGVKVSEYIPDLIVYELVIVDTKVIDRITDLEVGQMLDYPRITGLPVGLILNFKILNSNSAESSPRLKNSSATKTSDLLLINVHLRSSAVKKSLQTISPCALIIATNSASLISAKLSL